MNPTISNDGVEPARVVSCVRYLEALIVFLYQAPQRTNIVVEIKAASGEVGGKRAASCARYLEALMVFLYSTRCHIEIFLLSAVLGEVDGKQVVLRARCLETLMVFFYQVPRRKKEYGRK